MIHPDTEVRFIDQEVGYGVFAREFIPRGTVTWVRNQLDREFSPPELEAFDSANRETLDRYSYRNAKGHYVFCWDHARFMNHSAQPTCLLTPYGLEIAVRDIQADDELSNDYGCFNIIEPFSPKAEADGRATVQHDDLTRYSAHWDAQIAAAVSFLNQVNQPLLRLIAPAVWKHLGDATRGHAALRSTAELFFHGE